MGRQPIRLGIRLPSHRHSPADALQGLGGAAAVLATAASGSSMSPLVAGLAPRGKLTVLGAAPDPVQAQTGELITRTIQGHLTGTSIANEDNLAFGAANGTQVGIETFPLSEAPKACQHMRAGKARFRVVLNAAA
ncbi:hypothetical protein ABT009_36815 [Streptomyces sp. NPDC002896]|uniref:hypothetical protein n=1 Tax=Streptomyces sp. NPDC002896 TaxID=3154438 RepID=UPI003326C6BD